jgi:hypothetical protein
MSSAVVVIDVQESVLAGCADVPEVVKRINVLARRARQEKDDGELSGAQVRDLVTARFASLRAPGRAIVATPAAEITF